MNMLKIMCLIQDESEGVALVKDLRLVVVHRLNTELNIGFDRAEAVVNIIAEECITKLKEKEII